MVNENHFGIFKSSVAENNQRELSKRDSVNQYNAGFFTKIPVNNSLKIRRNWHQNKNEINFRFVFLMLINNTN